MGSKNDQVVNIGTMVRVAGNIASGLVGKHGFHGEVLTDDVVSDRAWNMMLDLKAKAEKYAEESLTHIGPKL